LIDEAGIAARANVSAAFLALKEAAGITEVIRTLARIGAEIARTTGRTSQDIRAVSGTLAGVGDLARQAGAPRGADVGQEAADRAA
jgi:hypothetical protein